MFFEFEEFHVGFEFVTVVDDAVSRPGRDAASPLAPVRLALVARFVVTVVDA